jgi:hypothetical protein
MDVTDTARTPFLSSVYVQAGGMSFSAASASMPTCSAPASATPSQRPPAPRRSLDLC